MLDSRLGNNRKKEHLSLSDKIQIQILNILLKNLNAGCELNEDNFLDYLKI